MNNSTVIPAKEGIQLNKLRSTIDKADLQILKLFKKRFELVFEIGKIKKENKLKIKDLKREKEVLDKIAKKAEDLNLSPVLIKKIWKLFFNESYKLEK